MKYSIISSLTNFIRLYFSGKVERRTAYINKSIVSEFGTFLIFRHITLSDKTRTDKSAVLVLRFFFPNNSLKKDRRKSFFQIPFFVGLPGYEGKLWTYNMDDGSFQGIYQWRNVEYAKAYLESFAVQFVKKKALKGSVRSLILPDTSLESYIASKTVHSSGITSDR